MSSRTTQAELLDATVRKLTEQGYDVIVEPGASLLPPSLQKWRPDAVAIGREPRLVVEIASESQAAAARIAELQAALRSEPGWKLQLVLDRASGSPAVPPASVAQIDAVLDSALSIVESDARGAMLLGWAAFEALGRSRRPDDFARPQSPGRLIERLASHGEILPSDAQFLREMATHRNRFIHGDLVDTVAKADVVRFIEFLISLSLEPAADQG